MTENNARERAERAAIRLYAALKHERSCVCGECSGGLNAVDALLRDLLVALDRVEDLEGELQRAGDTARGLLRNALLRVEELEAVIRDAQDFCSRSGVCIPTDVGGPDA